MKQLLLVLIAVAYSAPLYADCSDSGISIFPRQSTIKQNPIFILEGYLESQPIITGLNKQYPIYLQNDHEKVRLQVTETLIGQVALTQAVLKPEKELEAGTEYTLIIENLPEHECIALFGLAPIIYKVTLGRDLEKPLLNGKVRVLKKTLVHYGCGPSTHVLFSNPATDSSALLVKVKLKSIKSGKETAYYIQVADTYFGIGRGMCSGAFSFNSGNTYEATFVFMDASGNTASMKGEKLQFTKPTVLTPGEDHGI